jgi:cytoskeleton protein RodZ
LRAAREKQGLHIAALAASIKVAPRKLDALENDRWHELPDATFTRALAQTVCRTLKIDARPVLDLLPPPERSALEPSHASLDAPFHQRGGEGGFAAAAIKPLIVAAALLMVAAVAVYLWPLLRPAQAPAPAVVVSTPVPAPPASAPPAAEAVAAPAASVPAAVEAAASAPAPAAAEAASRGETVFAAPAAASVPVIDGVLQIRVNEASWIEVRDARGRSLLSRTVLPGEAVGLDGELPLRLVVGNATGTQLSFRGQPVELAVRGRDNVARLELK